MFNAWFKDCFSYISQQDGFHALHRAFDDIETETVHIWLHFECREKMAAWGQTTEHAKLIARLDPYRTQDWEATWYDTDIPRVERFIIPLGEHNVLNN
jgi:hypothetical protein